MDDENKGLIGWLIMAQYIDKAALVAEIERRMKLRQDGYRKYNDVNDFVAFEELEYLHDEFLPTLEVKEVSLDLGSPDGDMGVKTVWDGDKIVSTKVQKGE